MTVKQAFEKAYGPLPEGATEIYIGSDCCNKGMSRGPTVIAGNRVLAWTCKGFWGHPNGHYPEPIYPDISDRLAEAFLGFFGPEYDKVVAIGTFEGGYVKDSTVPELKQAKPEDFKPGAWIYYPDADEGTYIAVVDEVHRPNSEWKAFSSKCGSRYGLDGAMVAVSE